MDEAQFLNELKHSFHDAGCYFYKIPDPPFVPKGGGGFTPSRPCDALAEVNGKLIAIEAKVQLDGKPWVFSKLRDSQRQGLAKVESYGKNKSFVFICFKHARGIYTCAIVPWGMIGERGSIKPDWGMSVPRVNERYDLIPWMEEILLQYMAQSLV